MPSNGKIDEKIFECIQCGECCKGYGGTFLSAEDINNIADHLNISPQKVISDYCQLSGGKPLLAVGKDGYCIFLDKICTIHSIKPRMCRSWPFIEGVLKDVANWRSMASCCPGMNPDASEQTILEAVKSYLDTMK